MEDRTDLRHKFAVSLDVAVGEQPSGGHAEEICEPCDQSDGQVRMVGSIFEPVDDLAGHSEVVCHLTRAVSAGVAEGADELMVEDGHAALLSRVIDEMYFFAHCRSVAGCRSSSWPYRLTPSSVRRTAMASASRRMS